MAKSLIRLSMSLKNMTILPRYIGTTRFCYNDNQLQEVTKDVLTRVGTTKELFEILKKNNEPASLLSSIEINKNIVEGQHIIVALSSMQKFYEANGFSSSEIQNSEHFKNMCSILNKHLITLYLPQVIQALKVLNSMKVPSSTMIMQSLLQLVRSSVNDLSLEEIFYLSFLLKHMEETHLSKAINAALPKVFAAQYRLQLDRSDIKELKNALRYASDNVQDPKIIKYLVDAIADFRGNVDVNSATSILWSLSKIESLPYSYLGILEKIKRIIIENINLLKPFDVVKTVIQISQKTISGDDNFYEPFLVDKLISKIVADDYGFDTGITALNSLNKMKHINLKLLNYLSSKYCKNPEILSNSHPLTLQTLVMGLSIAHYKTLQWNELRHLLVDNHTWISNRKNLCYYALHLASLDCFDDKMLTRIFDIPKDFEISMNSYLQPLKKLYFSVKILYPEYSGPWPSESLIKSFENVDLNISNEPKDYLLLPALEKILGKSTYVKTNLKTKQKFDIDYLIIMKDGQPVTFDSVVTSENLKSNYIEDLNIPPEYKILILLQLPPEVYGRNILILQAPVSLNIKLLKAMSYDVRYISLDSWKTMPEPEKLPYLQNLINTKVERSIIDTDHR